MALKNDLVRCPWVNEDPLYQAYHDTEWGIPIHDDQKLFEYLILDTFQAGLSWLTVLKKRENFRKAFSQFNATHIALYDEAEVERLLRDSGIIRHRLKIEAAIANAQAYLNLVHETGSFSDFIWQFTGNKVIHRSPQTIQDYQATSPESDAMSKALKKRGFKFVGSTTCYAFMQAAGLINDHTVNCHCYKSA